MMGIILFVVIVETVCLLLLFGAITWVLSRPQIKTVVSAVAGVPDLATDTHPSEIAKLGMDMAGSLAQFTVPADDEGKKP